MISWLVQSMVIQPGQARGFIPPSLLNPQEQDRLAALKTEKRRQDWLLGRWTSKLLLQAVIRRDTGETVQLSDLTIHNQKNGAPYATWEVQHGNLPISFSISHSGEWGFCAACGVRDGNEVPLGIIGADIERVEERPPGFVEDYFTETEISLVNRLPLDAWKRDILVTATWSAKEAALKAIHLGLTVDTRSVTCSLDIQGDPEHSWQPFGIEWDVRRLNHRNREWRPVPISPAASPSMQGEPAGKGRSTLDGGPNLSGWWRIMGDCVLTLAAQENPAAQETPANTLADFGELRQSDLFMGARS